MKPLVSVIVPVYNVERYLDECVQSIFAQTYTNLEILLIDDGSTDQSGAMCDQYALSDSRVRVIHQENGGSARAKNVGIEHASGEYIVFVDSDDKADITQIEKLYDQLKKHDADIAMGDYFVYNERDNYFYYYVLDEQYLVEVIDRQEAINRQEGIDRNLVSKRNTATYISPCCKLYKKELFDTVRFPEGVKFDDEFTIHKLYLRSNRIVVIVENLYMYRHGHGSQMSETFNLRWVRDVIRAFETKLSDVALAGLDTKTIRQRFLNILHEYRNKMEAYHLTDTEEYRLLIFRLQTLNASKTTHQEKKVIALGATYSYADQVLTTIKSVCYHNRNVRIYVLNSDFPQEWFWNLNRQLSRLQCEVVNARVDSSIIRTFNTNIHFSSYLRYYIPELIEEDKVLYLDCDLIVTRELTELWNKELGNSPVMAAKDLGGQYYYGEHFFNAGVMLINNRLWKKEKVTKQLIALTNEHHEKVPFADQSILNLLFKDRWLPLEFQYNCITLHTNFSDYRPEKNQYPPIIHYLTERKPWKMYEQSIYRDVWWFYYGLEFSEMHDVVPSLKQETIRDVKTTVKEALIYTYSDYFEGLMELIEQLPEIQFNIAAPVTVSENITNLLKYPNVVVQSGIASLQNLVDNLVERSDFLLDINYGEEVDGIVRRFREQDKPVFAFDTVVHGDQGQLVFSAKEPADMVASIQTFCQTGEVPEKKSETDGWNFVVKDISESLDFILEHHSSVARYGDGEMDIMTGHSIPYQDYDEDLAQELRHIVALQSDEHLLVCLSDVFDHLERYRPETIAFWQGHLEQYQEAYRQWCKADWYGSTFISRPYMDQLDKSLSVGYFDKLKQLWHERDILIVEGVTSRSGVGNDLFAGARSIQRIICPSRNAYQQRDLIQETVEKYGQDKLILLMLGPTAKVIAYHLSRKGYQAIDIGHIDSEYEWFQMGATEKVKLSHKHTAEHNFDQDIEFMDDELYASEVVERIELD